VRKCFTVMITTSSLKNEKVRRQPKFGKVVVTIAAVSLVPSSDAGRLFQLQRLTSAMGLLYCKGLVLSDRYDRVVMCLCILVEYQRDQGTLTSRH